MRYNTSMVNPRGWTELLDRTLPLNRKERYFTGTVLTALVGDNLQHLDRLGQGEAKMRINGQQARMGLAGIRVAVGVGAVAAPRAVGSAFGFRPEENPEAPALARLFGIRNMALGLDLLRDEGGLSPRANMAIDLADAAAIIGGGLRGYLSKRALVLGSATALLAAALGAVWGSAEE